jgi:hypothetical protein
MSIAQLLCIPHRGGPDCPAVSASAGEAFVCRHGFPARCLVLSGAYFCSWLLLCGGTAS